MVQHRLFRLCSVTTEKRSQHDCVPPWLSMDKDRESLATVLAYLKKHGLKETEEILRREAQDELLTSVEGSDYASEKTQLRDGALLDESLENESHILSINRTRVFYGLPKEPDINIPADFEFSDDDDDTEDEDRERPNKRRRGISKKDFYARRFKSDPNAPPSNRVPFPPLSELEKTDKLYSMKDAMKSARLGPERLPSICGYTLMNADSSICSASLPDDSSLIATGYMESKIRVHTVTSRPLRTMRSTAELAEVDPEADDIFERIMDDTTASPERILHAAHAGPIYSTSFSPDKRWLVAGCGDGTIRLWNLWLWSNLVNYNCHMYPVSHVEFSPMGYYFASCGADRVARIWSTEYVNPLRLLVGHNDDIYKVHFHPNANYVATASADKTIRMWDVVTGNCVRYLTGHKDAPQALAFSRCGKYLASGGRDGGLHLWDIAMAKEVMELDYHKKPIYSIAFSRENTVMASSGHDGQVALWNFKGLSDLYQADNVSFGSTSTQPSYLIRAFPTRKTCVLDLHFTRRNVLLVTGKYGDT